MCGCLLHAPYRGAVLQPRHVSWLGIEPATFWFAGWHSIHWATPARAHFHFYKILPSWSLKWARSLSVFCASYTLSTSIYSVLIKNFVLSMSVCLYAFTFRLPVRSRPFSHVQNLWVFFLWFTCSFLLPICYWVVLFLMICCCSLCVLDTRPLSHLLLWSLQGQCLCVQLTPLLQFPRQSFVWGLGFFSGSGTGGSVSLS